MAKTTEKRTLGEWSDKKRFNTLAKKREHVTNAGKHRINREYADKRITAVRQAKDRIYQKKRRVAEKENKKALELS
jgi:hypothetical protein